MTTQTTDNKTKTIVVTGGTRGIGLQTAIALAQEGHHIVITGRDGRRAARARSQIEAGATQRVDIELADLSSAAQVAQLAARLTRHAPIDVLINNAGVLSTVRETNAQGIEMNFAVNVVAPYALSVALQGAMAQGGRVINVTGGLMSYGIVVDDLQAERQPAGLVAYSRSKRALDAMTMVLAQELKPRGIRALLVFPGEAATAMSRGMTPKNVPWWMLAVWPLFALRRGEDNGKSATRAAQSSIWAATAQTISEDVIAFNQACKPMPLHRTVLDQQVRDEVMKAVRGAAAVVPVATQPSDAAARSPAPPRVHRG